MDWTVRWFKRMRDLWDDRAERARLSNCLGHSIYAEKCRAMWENLMHDAEAAFKNAAIKKAEWKTLVDSTSPDAMSRVEKSLRKFKVQL